MLEYSYTYLALKSIQKKPQESEGEISQAVSNITILIDNQGSGYLGLARWFNVHS